MDVFVLGYPFGPGKTGLPVWKRGSIASEPDLVPQVENYLLVDTASRPGMSGSPVILRTYGTHMSRGEITLTPGPANKFIVELHNFAGDWIIGTALFVIAVASIRVCRNHPSSCCWFLQGTPSRTLGGSLLPLTSFVT
jgi:hypothetical protein